MSLIVPDFDESVIVRSTEAEVIGQAPSTIRLLADSSTTGGALSTQRVTLIGGNDGARPHHHAGAAELFYMLDGTAEVLSGDQVVTVERGDLVVVPPGRAHAFAAAPGRTPTSSSPWHPASNGSSTSATWGASPAARCRPRACWRSRSGTTPTSSRARPGRIGARGRLLAPGP